MIVEAAAIETPIDRPERRSVVQKRHRLIFIDEVVDLLIASGALMKIKYLITLIDEGVDGRVGPRMPTGVSPLPSGEACRGRGILSWRLVVQSWLLLSAHVSNLQ